MAQPALRRRNSIARGVFLMFLLLAGAPFAHASTIDPVHKYAWGTVTGWVNFAPTDGGLTITDSAITGYAWGANTGWINFNATNGAVTNTTTGTLGGFAWDEGAGWVSFTGVTIDANGRFHGTATGGTVNGASYVINFDCANCNVSTDWRPTSSNSSPSASPASPASPGSISPISFNNLSLPSITQSPSPSVTQPPSPSANVGGGNGSSVGGSSLLKQSLGKKASTTATTTKSFSSKVLSVIRAAAVPVSIFSLLILAFFLFFL